MKYYETNVKYRCKKTMMTSSEVIIDVIKKIGEGEKVKNKNALLGQKQKNKQNRQMNYGFEAEKNLRMKNNFLVLFSS